MPSPLNHKEWDLICSAAERGGRFSEVLADLKGLQDDAVGGRDKKTIGRHLSTITQLCALRIEHPDQFEAFDREAADQIAIAVKWGAESASVLNDYHKYKAWLREQNPNRLEQRHEHLSMLKAEVQNLRNCLMDPLDSPAVDGRDLLGVVGVLDVGPYDWRLDPVMWFYRTTPDFTSRERWGYSFPLLKEHMKESPFWTHYEELREATEQLERDYQQAAARLRSKYKEFDKEWDRITAEKERRRKTWSRPCLYPGVPQEEVEEYRPCYDHDYCERAIKGLSEAMPDIVNRLMNLETGLEQLNRDLNEHEVNPIIMRGHCAKCP